MNTFLIPCLSVLFLILPSCNSKEQPAEKEEQTGTTYHLYFAGGQSNMDGYGYVSDLPQEYTTTLQDVMIFNGNQLPDDSTGGGQGKWMPLSPGFGAGYKATKDSVYLSDRFGPELSFGKRMAELSDKKIAIIKYARGGSSIAIGGSAYGTWGKEYPDSTTINQWDHFQNTLYNALADKDLDDDGINDTLIPSGIIWMQGEADAYQQEASAVYYENLTRLMNNITEAFGTEELPIVICRIEDSGKTPEDRVMPHIEAVWEAQEKYAADNDNVTLIRLEQPIGFLEDKWHYNSKHYLEMGNKFAEALD